MDTYDLQETPVQVLIQDLPGVNSRHLVRMTDDTGMLQHARFSVPNREHGYCVDDNARALVAACWGRALGTGDLPADLVNIYLSFLNHALPSGSKRFRNFMTYDRVWPESAGSEEAHGRAIWGLGTAASMAPLEGERKVAQWLLYETAGEVERFTSLRAWAFTVLGLGAFFTVDRDDEGLLNLMRLLAERIAERFEIVATDGWRWCEEYLTYDNAIVPLSLLVASRRLNDEAMRDTALDALAWLMDLQTEPQGHISLVGNNGWMWRGREHERARFDQQPLDATALVLACAEAYEITGDSMWAEHMSRAVRWFTGYNDVGQPLHDEVAGGCCDGLCESGVNLNLGAESTLAWLLARMRVERLMRQPEMRM